MRGAPLNRLGGAEGGAGEGERPLLVGRWYAHQVTDDGERQLGGDVDDEVALATRAMASCTIVAAVRRIIGSSPRTAGVLR